MNLEKALEMNTMATLISLLELPAHLKNVDA